MSYIVKITSEKKLKANQFKIFYVYVSTSVNTNYGLREG